MIYDYKKLEKDLYCAKQTPTIIDVKSQTFITIKGEGDPNEEDFSARVSLIFTLSYGIKMYHKALNHEYMVDPLEGVWESSDSVIFDKSKLKYTLQFRQPDFITKELFEEVKRKKKIVSNYDIKLDSLIDGKAVQLLHIGSYDEEPRSFKVMDDYLLLNHLKRVNNVHGEIYLNNKNRTSVDNLKTILRYSVKGENE